jgi:hypothetical protein
MKRHVPALLFLLLLAGLFLVTSRTGATGNGLVSVLNTAFDLSWWTVDGGGHTAVSGGAYTLGGTIGQADAGVLSGSDYSVNGGFWNSAAAAGTPTPTPTQTHTPTASHTPMATASHTPTTTATHTPAQTPTVTSTPGPTPATAEVYLPIVVNQP